jgi:hypothetical protein
MTVGVGLLLPNIPLLTALGFVVLIVSNRLGATEQEAGRRVLRLFFMLACAMAIVLHTIYGGDGLTRRETGPHTWLVMLLLVGWALGMAVEYRRWRLNRGNRSAPQERCI